MCTEEKDADNSKFHWDSSTSKIILFYFLEAGLGFYSKIILYSNSQQGLGLYSLACLPAWLLVWDVSRWMQQVRVAGKELWVRALKSAHFTASHFY